MMTNEIYGEDKSVFTAGYMGFLFSGAGTILGNWSNRGATALLPALIGGNLIDPSIPILLQNIGRPNPYPGYIGSAVEQGVSNVPSFLDNNPMEGTKP